jgi:hypothetical protein
MRTSKWTIAEARLLQKATAPHQHAMQMIRGAIEELFGPIAGLESEYAEMHRSADDPLQDARDIVESLQRIAEHMRERQH